MDKSTAALVEQVGTALVPVIRAALSQQATEYEAKLEGVLAKAGDRIAELETALWAALENNKVSLSTLLDDRVIGAMKGMPTAPEVRVQVAEIRSQVNELVLTTLHEYGAKTYGHIDEISKSVQLLSREVVQYRSEVGAAAVSSEQTHERLSVIEQAVSDAQLRLATLGGSEEARKLQLQGFVDSVGVLQGELRTLQNTQNELGTRWFTLEEAVAELSATKDAVIAASQASAADAVEASVEKHVGKLHTAVAARIKTLVSETVAALPPPRDGRDGKDGKDGRDGKDGEKGLNGKDGEKGLDGNDGKDGRDGEDGTFGAVEVHVPGKLYDALALVSASGGVWQAVQATTSTPGEKLAGGVVHWRCIVNGLQSAALIVDDDGRTFTVKTVSSTGEVSEHTAQLNAMVYRGIFNVGTTYAKDDVVTHSGSLWLALKKEVKSSPADPTASEDWQLIVKRGNSGKDGRDGKDGVAAPPAVAGFVGMYENNKMYKKNQIVEYDGSVWLAKRLTSETPPYLTREDNDYWLRLR